jgi:hypothetical protein
MRGPYRVIGCGILEQRTLKTLPFAPTCLLPRQGGGGRLPMLHEGKSWVEPRPGTLLRSLFGVQGDDFQAPILACQTANEL